MFRVMFFLTLLSIVLMSCGQKGPLYLPDDSTLNPTPTPLSNTPHTPLSTDYPPSYLEQ